jgi:uncharacterized membrane protein
MNGSHFHLIFSHVPIIGVAFTILLIIFALLKKSKDLKQTALWFAVIAGITALLAYYTGDGAENVVKTVPGITESLIETHELWGLYYLLSLILIGVIALAGLLLSRASASVLQKFVIIILILCSLSLYLAAKTGITGGKIRHTEMDLKGPFPDVDDDD